MPSVLSYNGRIEPKTRNKPQKANGLISTPTHGGVGLAAEFIKKNRQVSRYLRAKTPGHRRANLGMRRMISSRINA